jgi:type IV pilus assembly protein PilV
MNFMMQRQRGATLIEVLVTFVILAVGILGLAGLQARALSYNQSALYRSQATALTDDILDRMRANRTAATGGNYSTALSATSSSISGSTVAATDLKDWKAQVEALLPQGQASIAVTSDTLAYEITIQWDDSRGRSSSAQSFVTRSKL